MAGHAAPVRPAVAVAAPRQVVRRLGARAVAMAVAVLVPPSSDARRPARRPPARPAGQQRRVGPAAPVDVVAAVGPVVAPAVPTHEIRAPTLVADLIAASKEAAGPVSSPLRQVGNCLVRRPSCSLL